METVQTPTPRVPFHNMVEALLLRPQFASRGRAAAPAARKLRSRFNALGLGRPRLLPESDRHLCESFWKRRRAAGRLASVWGCHYRHSDAARVKRFSNSVKSKLWSTG